MSGYGQIRFTDHNAPTQFLKQVHVGIPKTADCKKKFSEPTLLGTNTDYYLDSVAEICAGGQEELDACTVRYKSYQKKMSDCKFLMIGESI